MPALVLLGPQRRSPVLREVCAEEGIGDDHQPVALITSGWEEREGEDEVLVAYLDRPCVNLALFQRAERVFERDPELFAALRRRHDRMRQLRTAYRRRLDHAIAACHELLAPPGKGPEDEFAVLGELEQERSPLMAEVLQEAEQALRDLDGGHLDRVGRLEQDFRERWSHARRDALATEREQVLEQLERCGPVLLAGGHVMVMLNRLRLFDLAGPLAGHDLVAWAAGAMVLTERIVLFHDSPPQGHGHPELFEPGLGLAAGLVALPDAALRLRLHDPRRVAGLARRMQPALCVPLDVGERAVARAGGWRLERIITHEGQVERPA